MAKKKPSASSRPEKQISVSAESIFSKPLSKKQKVVLSRIAKREAAGDDSDIDYSDIPPLTDEQLAQFRRTPKVLVAARIDREVLGGHLNPAIEGHLKSGQRGTHRSLAAAPWLPGQAGVGSAGCNAKKNKGNREKDVEISDRWVR